MVYQVHAGVIIHGNKMVGTVHIDHAFVLDTCAIGFIKMAFRISTGKLYFPELEDLLAKESGKDLLVMFSLGGDLLYYQNMSNSNRGRRYTP